MFDEKFVSQTASCEQLNEERGIQNSQSRLFLSCILFSLIILLGIMFYILKHTYSSARSDVIELSKSSSAQNAENLELFFLRHEDVLLTTATVLEAKMKHDFSFDSSTEKNDIEELLRDISLSYSDSIYSKYTDKPFTGIYAAVNGHLVHGLKTQDDLPEGYNPLERQWYKEAVAADGDVFFGEPYQDIYTPFMVMTATKLLSDKKTVIGMDITLEDLQFTAGKMEVSITLSGNHHIYGYGFVVSDRGIVMAHRNIEEQGKCYDDVDSPMYDVFQQVKQYTDTAQAYFETDVGGVNYGIFPCRLSNGWYVVTLTDLEDIRNSVSSFSSVIVIGTGFVVFFVLLYCVLITRAQFKSEKLTENLIQALILAKKDGLTGYSNRTAYDIFTKELAKKLSTKADRSFAVIMMDLNDLKYVNDRYGHATGDQYIRKSCQLVREIIPSEIYRIGGDEFALFLRDELFDNRDELWLSLKKAVEPGNLLSEPDVEKPSMAFGMSIHWSGENDNMAELLAKADAEMYSDKVSIKQTRLYASKIDA